MDRCSLTISLQEEELRTGICMSVVPFSRCAHENHESLKIHIFASIYPLSTFFCRTIHSPTVLRTPSKNEAEPFGNSVGSAVQYTQYKLSTGTVVYLYCTCSLCILELYLYLYNSTCRAKTRTLAAKRNASTNSTNLYRTGCDITGLPLL